MQNIARQQGALGLTLVSIIAMALLSSCEQTPPPTSAQEAEREAQLKQRVRRAIEHDERCSREVRAGRELGLDCLPRVR